MDIKVENEITVKVMVSKDELFSKLKKEGFYPGRTFSLDDYYFIPSNIDVQQLTTREILAKAVIIRNIFDDNVYKKKITYKIKEFDKNGDILNQEAINCSIYDIDEAKNLLNAIGYIEIMNIKENDTIFKKDNFELAIKEVLNGDILIEVETVQNTEYDTIEKLKQKISNIEIPIESNEYFIKKAEIQLNKILNR